MPKYRKKTLIDAEPYKPGMEDGNMCSQDGCECQFNCCTNCGGCKNGCKYRNPYIKTLEDTDSSVHYISPTDYIATGVKGERWPIKKDIFEATYEKVIK